MACVVAFIGTARPRPMPATAVLTPMSLAWEPASAPARAERGSAPTTSTSYSVQSMKEALAARPAATTWAEVTRKPSGVMTTPEPAPPKPRPPRPMRRLATDGRTASATELTMTEYASSASSSVGVSTIVLQDYDVADYAG